MHLPQLIIDLVLLLGAAAVVTLLFKWLKQPAVLGYIIAGLIVGPHFALFPSVNDEANIEIWAEIGVIFLLFSLGLEFSFKKLMKVGGPALITAGIQIVVMIFLGYGIGQVMGWRQIDSIFLGAILSMSSTTIILRAFDELGVKGKQFAGLVFGALIVEDIVAIILLVLLSTIAVSQKFAGMEALFSITKLAFFLTIWFVVGIFFLPTILRKIQQHLNDEMLLITSLALCLLMVLLAVQVGFSPALGAFVMGSILAETTLGERIEHLTKSVKELFGAVFFVSVGMMIDPAMLVKYAGPIAIVTVVTIVGKTFGTFAGALVSGQSLKTSVQSGMSLAQIGEFSFIIATLGVTLGVTSNFLYPITVAVSAVTTFTTPYMIRGSGRAYEVLNEKLPTRWTSAIARYAGSTQNISRGSGDWNSVIKSFLSNTIIYTVIVVGIVLLVQRYVVPYINMPNSHLANLCIVLGTVIVMLPFLWALALRQIKPEIISRMLQNPNYRRPLYMLQLMRMVLAAILVGFVINSFLSFAMAVAALFIMLALMLVFRNKLQVVSEWIENHFFRNFHFKEENGHEESNKDKIAHLAPWDAHFTSFNIDVYFPGIGQTLYELQFRERFGINIAAIKRGDKSLNAPQRDERIYPGDKLFVIGTDEQVEAFSAFIQKDDRDVTKKTLNEQNVTLQQLNVRKGSPLVGKSIKESAIRERTHGLIVGIERDGQRILNPESHVLIEAEDVIWIAGHKNRILVFLKEM